MQINYKNEVISIRISEFAIMRGCCYYTRLSDDSESFVIGLDVLQLFQTGFNLFKLLRQSTSAAFNVPFISTGKTILFDGSFGMAIQASCINDQWSYILTLGGVVDENTQSGSFEILSFTPGEQGLIDRYVDKIIEAVERGRGRVIANVANVGA